MNLIIEKRKLDLFLRSQGKTFDFIRYAKNRYNERTEEVLLNISIVGIYHEVRNKIEEIEGSVTKYYSVVDPMILGRFIDIQNVVEKGDILYFNNQILEVTGVTNVNKLNVYSDISLKVIDDE